MAYRLPSFNLPSAIWRHTSPVAAAPDVLAPCNLSLGRRVTMIDGTNGDWSLQADFLLPKLTDVRPDVTNVFPTRADCIEVPRGSGRYYVVLTVDDVAKGFANEYRLATGVQVNNTVLARIGNPWAAPLWPFPFP